MKEADLERDLRLGFRIPEVEAGLARVRESLGGVAELWASRGPGVFQTPYGELELMLGALALPEGSHVVDLGAGYGRLGLVIAEAFPKLRFTGFEISPERVAEARRVYALQGLDPGQMREADLSSPEFVPPAAQAYLIYDFGTRPAVEKVLRDLQTLARGQSFQVIGRGRLSRDLIERHHPWLSQVHPPRHMGNFSIYSG